MCLWGSEGNLQAFALDFCHVDPGAQTQGFRLERRLIALTERSLRAHFSFLIKGLIKNSCKELTCNIDYKFKALIS